MSTTEEISAPVVKFKRKSMKGNVNLPALSVGEVEATTEAAHKSNTQGLFNFFMYVFLMTLLIRR